MNSFERELVKCRKKEIFIQIVFSSFIFDKKHIETVNFMREKK
jgi:hypothetical protein